MELWRELLDRLKEVQLTEEDKVTWALEKDGICTTKSLYRHVAFGGVISRRMKEVWKTKVPLKVRIFICQMFHDKLQYAEQLTRRNWKGDINCPLCGVVEDVDHVMFRCVCLGSC
jgi:hypothetical protein